MKKKVIKRSVVGSLVLAIIWGILFAKLSLQSNLAFVVYFVVFTGLLLGKGVQMRLSSRKEKE